MQCVPCTHLGSLQLPMQGAAALTYHPYGRYYGVMSSASEVLDHAVAVLGRGEALTFDAVAREAGLTKPGVVHHFATKEILASSVVGRVIDRWEAGLTAHARDADGAVERLRAYVDYALAGDFDLSDFAFMVDVRIRDQLSQQWTERLHPWFGFDIEGTATQRAARRAGRLIADGAWFNNSLAIPTLRDDERDAVIAIAHRLITEGTPA